MFSGEEPFTLTTENTKIRYTELHYSEQLGLSRGVTITPDFTITKVPDNRFNGHEIKVIGLDISPNTHFILEVERLNSPVLWMQRKTPAALNRRDSLN